MMKPMVCVAALLLPLMASASNPPAANPPAPAATEHTLPHSMAQTSRAAAMKAMTACQQSASALKGADKQQAVQACMRSAH